MLRQTQHNRRRTPQYTIMKKEIKMKRNCYFPIANKTLLGVTIILLCMVIPSCGRHRSHRNANTSSRTIVEKTSHRHTTSQRGGNSTVKMRASNGVYYVPCMINGTSMEFIFDTGASDIVMSLTEALFLYKQGKLSDDDIIDNVVFQIADGSIGEGTVVNLNTVTIGNKTLHNVEATIISNMEAPLLLGQSALSRFGKLSIDYNRNEISFE